MIKIEYDEHTHKVMKFYVFDGDDQKNGPFKVYHKDGSLWETGTYKNGKLTDLYEVYYSDGRLARRCFYQNGLRCGIYERYYSTGFLEVRCHYKDGKYDGVYERYYPNGRLRESLTYQNGILDGLNKYYDKKGNLQYEEVMFQGKRVKLNHREIKKSRKILGKELAQTDKKIPLGQSRQQIKRKLIASFRSKYPKAPILGRASEQLCRQKN